MDWSTIAPAIEQWYLKIREELPNGPSTHTIPGLPFTLEVHVDCVPLKRDRGFFFVSRVMPDKPLIDTVRQALKTKVDKLTAASADKRILLLEKEIPIFSDGEAGELVQELLPEFPKLAQIDEVWLANTVALASEDYFAIDLAWPLDAALARDEARNAT